MNYKRGDVVLVLFPNSDLQSAKRRPVVLVQNTMLETGLSQVIVAMITSKMFRAGRPSRVTILLDSTEGKQSGLLTDSVIMADNLATVQEIAIDQRIGSIRMDEVDVALRHTLSL